MVEGVTQIYSADYGVAQCIEAHATTFSTYKFDGNLYESTVLCLASRPLDLPNGKVVKYSYINHRAVLFVLMVSLSGYRYIQLNLALC